MAKLVFTDHSGEWRTGSDFPKIPLTAVAWDSAPDTPVAYVFFGHVNIDFDGSPTAYGPPGMTPPPDDDLGNAGDDSSGWYGLLALAPDDPLVTQGTVSIDTNPALQKKGKFPVVQQAANGDPSPGYYVSTTPQASGPAYLQSSYIDASQVAFGALSGKLASLGFSLGDYGLAIRHDQDLQSGFYFVDRGGNNYALGECSHKVGKNLGGSGRGNAFNNNFPVSFIVFPGSFDTDPSALPSISDDQLKTALQPLLAKLAAADNAADLVLLMGFNESSPPTKPQGTSKLSAHQAQPGGANPKNAATILQGLAAFGYAASLASADDTSGDDGSSSSTVAASDGSAREDTNATAASDSGTSSNGSEPAAAAVASSA